MRIAEILTVAFLMAFLKGPAFGADQAVGGIANFTVKPTPMFVGKDGSLLRVLDASCSVEGSPAQVTFSVEDLGAAPTAVAKPTSAKPELLITATQELLVPDSATPKMFRVTATAGSATASVTVNVEPCRKWKIFVAASCHTDIGYTDLQPKVAEVHNENIDIAMALIKKYPDFRWNAEAAWEMQNYLAARPEPQRQEYLQYLRNGKMGVQACYCNLLTGLLSPEGATRMTWFAAQAHRLFGLPYDSAMISDVPSLEGSVPTILADSGIRYFSEGMNATHFSTAFRRLNPSIIGAPCWWEGLDGSRVMMIFAPSYYQARILKMDATIGVFRTSLTGDLDRYGKRTDYPYDAIFLHGATGDNMVLTPALADVGAEWNRRYTYPQCIFCTNDAFFKYIEANYDTRKLPVVRGSAGTCWEDGAGSSAQETRLDRNAQQMLTDAEKLLSISSCLDATSQYPKDQFDQAWRNCLLYDEHTWGARASIAHPDDATTLAQWKIKAQYAIDANQSASALLHRGVESIASHVRHAGTALVVVNPSAWPRTDVLCAKLPDGFGVADPDIPNFKTDQGTYLLVKNVPACGYRTIPLSPAGSVPAAHPADQAAPQAADPADVEGTTLESKFYRITFDPATGGMASIVDKQTGRELVDAKAPYRANEYLYVASPPKTDLYRDKKPPTLAVETPSTAILKRIKLGDLGERMIVETSATQTPKIGSTITVWNDIKRVDIEDRLNKTQTYTQEAAYFAFPFAASHPVFRYEIPCGVVRVDKDMIPGACQAWFTQQHFVQLESNDGSVTWSSPDAPLVCLEEINRGTWPAPLPIVNGYLYSYIMNNYWWTNYKAGQGGDFVFRYAFTSDVKADVAESTRFGDAVASPLLAAVSAASVAGTLTEPVAGWVRVQESNVVLFGMPKSDAGSGIVLHLRETAGQNAVAHVTVGLPSIHHATLCNLMEEPQGALAVNDGMIAVPMKPWSIAAIKIE